MKSKHGLSQHWTQTDPELTRYKGRRSFEDDWVSVAFGGRLRLLEVCCSETSELTGTCEKVFGPGTAQRISNWNGGDVETKQGKEFVRDVLRGSKPQLLWMSPECGPYSPLQHLNMRNDHQRKALAEKREHARKQYEGVCELA